MYTITLTTEKLVKNPNTKTTYLSESKETKTITDEVYKNIVTSSPFFRRLGGTETAQKSYTCAGYKVTKLVSVSPDKKEKTIRTFIFDYDKKESKTNFENLSLMGKYTQLVNTNQITAEIKDKFKSYKTDSKLFTELHDLMDNTYCNNRQEVNQLLEKDNKPFDSGINENY